MILLFMVMKFLGSKSQNLAELEWSKVKEKDRN